MEDEQKALYMCALARAIALVVGPRNDDYNQSGIGLRDYWTVNGILSPIQMVDMKVKRARSIVNGMETLPMEKFDKLTESMVDAINYCAFTICEAASQAKDTRGIKPLELFSDNEMVLAKQLSNTIEMWRQLCLDK